MYNSNNENKDLENLSSEDIKKLFNNIIEMPEEDGIFISMCSKTCGGSCDLGGSYRTM